MLPVPPATVDPLPTRVGSWIGFIGGGSSRVSSSGSSGATPLAEPLCDVVVKGRGALVEVCRRCWRRRCWSSSSDDCSVVDRLAGNCREKINFRRFRNIAYVRNQTNILDLTWSKAARDKGTRLNLYLVWKGLFVVRLLNVRIFGMLFLLIFSKANVMQKILERYKYLTTG